MLIEHEQALHLYLGFMSSIYLKLVQFDMIQRTCSFTNSILGITYDISNKHRLGYSEVELVQCMIDGVNTLVKEDRELQKKHGIV